MQSQGPPARFIALYLIIYIYSPKGAVNHRAYLLTHNPEANNSFILANLTASA